MHRSIRRSAPLQIYLSAFECTVQQPFKKADGTPFKLAYQFALYDFKISGRRPFKFTYPPLNAPFNRTRLSAFECTRSNETSKKRLALLIHSNLLIRF